MFTATIICSSPVLAQSNVYLTGSISLLHLLTTPYHRPCLVFIFCLSLLMSGSSLTHTTYAKDYVTFGLSQTNLSFMLKFNFARGAV